MALSNNVDLENLRFVECQALYGGAVYIYSESDRNTISIIHCIFTRNSLLSSSGSENGGTAIFLTVKKGKVNDCTFSSHGKGNLIKVTDIYDGGLSAIQLSKQKSILLISSCCFEQTKESESSIFYESLNEISKIEIIKCSFKGELSNGSHYIECKAINENNFIEKSCSFEFNNKHAVCFKLNNASNNSLPNYLTNNLMIGGSILSVLTIIIAFIVLKSKKNKK